MASPTIANGTYVQLDPSPDNPRARPPSAIEQTIGIVRQSFLDKGEPYYQVVWNPGDRYPKVGMYHENELKTLTNKQAQDILSQIQAGTYGPDAPTQGSTYQPANLPTSALPPNVQGAGTFAPAIGSQQPSLLETS